MFAPLALAPRPRRKQPERRGAGAPGAPARPIERDLGLDDNEAVGDEANVDDVDESDLAAAVRVEHRRDGRPRPRNLI